MHVSPPAATSLVAVLYLASAVCQPTMGKVSLRWGTRRVFIYGLVLVAIGATLGAVGPNMTYLLVARALIGAGTSAAYPTSIALIRDRATSPNSDVPRMQMAVLAVAGQSTAAIGLPIGGLLIGLAGWRATFLANVPLALAGIAAALAWLPADRGRHHDDPPRRLDLVGIALFAVAVTSLLVFLEQLKPARWWVAAVSVGATAVLVVHELRFEDPFIDVRMLARSGGLRRTYIRNGLSFVAIYTVLYGMSQWLESVRDLSPQ